MAAFPIRGGIQMKKEKSFRKVQNDYCYHGIAVLIVGMRMFS